MSSSSSWDKIIFFFISFLGLCSAIEVSYDGKSLIINGERRIIFSGAVHYPRSTEEMWPDIIQKAKDGEWNYGGFPLWLHKMPGIELRTDNQVFKNEMSIFTSKIVNMAKEAKLFASQGGPVILAQIENEYGNIMWGYGDAGKAYVKWCAQMALAQNIGVPWFMCQQDDAPEGIINTCNGYYCDTFQPNNPKSPKMWTENWIGWFQNGGKGIPHRTAEDVAYSVARFFQNGGVLNNYYMYHGGTNFGRSAGGPYIMTSYDYDAPVDDSVTLTTYTSNTTEGRFCFLSNANEHQDAYIDLKDGNDKYFVPAWSVTILDNSREVFNTAKVNSQTSIMVKKSNYSELPTDKLTWAWRPEAMKDTMKGMGKLKSNKLLEQKDLTLDVSDYLWYMTTINIKDASAWKNATLRVNTQGHVLHSFVNKRFVGSEFSQWGNGFTFETPISLKRGRNIITLLSATVGLANYGVKFDLAKTGIEGGSVQLIGKNNVTMDLSNSSWSYKIGLNGEVKRLYDPSMYASSTNNPPVGRRMTWYATHFKTPSGTDPMVVDLQGMGKGEAWINGQSIGRYWPSMIASSDGCDEECDYRGAYKPEKCNYNCGNPSQRWYHVPRSFLNNNQGNTLVLFEEIGGNPQNVSFQTVTIGTICAYGYEGALLELSCQGGKTISEIQFASFGDPQGKCGSFQKGSWEASNSKAMVEAACLGKEKCELSVTREAFSASGIGNNATTIRLAVQALC
ncbi:hypothetical protein K1719_044763 [Acacia pycnantha]|nr:hypothetical protein K1719_044763 [Acacia pycnantha]